MKVFFALFSRVGWPRKSARNSARLIFKERFVWRGECLYHLYPALNVQKLKIEMSSLPQSLERSRCFQQIHVDFVFMGEAPLQAELN